MQRQIKSISPNEEERKKKTEQNLKDPWTESRALIYV
jgi:hypothetical protein